MTEHNKHFNVVIFPFQTQNETENESITRKLSEHMLISRIRLKE